ncbi:MAG: hypothetical protein U5Q44_10575 [Dehalococcoidia bacterium]|nr:hypothetical protein [Dehalococcoidia bacterium]
MDWQSDPALAAAEAERRARNTIIRQAVIWTPLFVVAFGGLVWALAAKLFFDGGATWFFIVVLTLLSFLFGYQSIHAIRDLRGGPTHRTGKVQRRWARTDSFVIRSHYIRLEDKQIYRIDKVFHDDVKEGDDVDITYYPHSAVVIHCERKPREEEQETEEQRRTRESTTARDLRF